MTGSAAIRKGVKEGIDDARLTDHTQQIAAKIGGDPTGLMARVEALEATVLGHANHLTTIDNELSELDDEDMERDTRLERHRLRIRWLERWAHSHWPGWFLRPGL